MRRNFPSIEFERYADDAVCHCQTQGQAEELRVALEERFAECGLELNAEKTKVVHCKDSSRRQEHPVTKFTFLGYDFRPRRARNRGGRRFVSFSPGVSGKAGKAIRQAIRGGGAKPRQPDAGRTGAGAERHDSRLDHLLRRLLQVGVAEGLVAD